MSYADKLSDWFYDVPTWVWVVALCVIAVVGVVAQNAALAQRCDGLMALARTRTDSLTARIACEKMRSDADMANAIRMQSTPRYAP